MKVLYATDGFEGANAARRLIAATFQTSGTEVTVATVTPSWSLDPGHLMLELDPIEGRRNDSKEIVSYAEAELRGAGFKTTGLVLEGQPGRVLMDEVSKGDYDVVVVGSGSHGWAGHRLLGSVSSLILHEAPCSVLVAHEFEGTDEVRKALVAVDGSETSEQTVEAISRVLDPNRVQIEVLSVAHTAVPVGVPVFIGPSHSSPETIRRLDEEQKHRANQHAMSSARYLQGNGFQVNSHVESGSPAVVILEEARQEKIDLIVVGSRGMGPVRRVLLGSVSDQVARLGSATFVGRFPKG